MPVTMSCLSGSPRFVYVFVTSFCQTDKKLTTTHIFPTEQTEELDDDYDEGFRRRIVGSRRKGTIGFLSHFTN